MNEMMIHTSEIFGNTGPTGEAIFIADGTTVTVEGEGVSPETLTLENLLLTPPPNEGPTGTVSIDGVAEEVKHLNQR